MPETATSLGHTIFSGIEKDEYLNEIYDALLHNYFLKLFQIEIGDADVPDHTLFFEPVQSAEGLFIRHQRIRPMDDHQIDIVSTQIFEGVFTLLQDQVSLAGAHILTVYKGVGAFCGDLHFPALSGSQVIESQTNVALSFAGMVLESSARSVTDSVVPWPGVRFSQVWTKSSTISVKGESRSRRLRT